MGPNRLAKVGGGKDTEHPKGGTAFFATGTAGWHYQEGKGPKESDNQMYALYDSIGIIMASGTVLTALLLRPMGRISDLMNRRSLVVGGSAGAALICICIPFVRDFWQLLVLAVLLGIFNVVSLPASYGLLVREGNKHGMGLTMGMFNAVMNVGFIVGPFVGGAILDVIGLRYVFYVGGAVGLLGLAPLMAFKAREVVEISGGRITS